VLQDVSGGVQDGIDGSVVDGFYVYLAPYGEHRAEYLRQQVVFGSSVRHAVLSRLHADTSYSIRMQSFSETAGVLSQLSNTVVQRTPGLFMVALCNRADHIYFHPVSSSSFFLA